MNTNQKPNLITAIGVMTLISGIVNIFWGLIASMSVLATIIGVVCTPLTILPTILGIFEVIYAAKLLGNPAQPVRPSTPLAVFEIACILAGNAFSMIVGILALVFYNDMTVKNYFDGLNGMAAPLPVAPEVAPVAPTISEPEAESAQPVEPEEPAKLRRPRKLA
jgi:hypothetical protein